MFNRSGIFSLVAAILIAAAPVLADSLTLITSPGAQSANDSIDWSQRGADATSLTASFPATSANGLGVTCDLAALGSLTSVVCPATPCSWGGASSGFVAGDELIWTSDAGNSGNGPLSLTFAAKVSGGGAFVQADGPATFTAKLEAFNGASSLGSFPRTSNGSGDPLYIGLKDTTAANVSKLVFSITACEGDCTDFAVDAVQLNNPMGPTPTPTATHTATATPTVTATPTPTATIAPTPVPANLGLSTKLMKFPSEPFGGTGKMSGPVTVMVKNPGGPNGFEVQLENIDPVPSANYALDSGMTTCTSVLAPGSKCAIALTFTPTGFGPNPGTLTLTDNAHNSPQKVTLKGKGIHGVLMVAPKPLPFGNQPSGTPSSPQPVTLTNNSGVPFEIGAITSTDPQFVPDQACANQTLADGASCPFNVTFTPASKGLKHGKLLINDDAAGSPQKVKMTGKGT